MLMLSLLYTDIYIYIYIFIFVVTVGLINCIIILLFFFGLTLAHCINQMLNSLNYYKYIQICIA